MKEEKRIEEVFDLLFINKIITSHFIKIDNNRLVNKESIEKFNEKLSTYHDLSLFKETVNWAKDMFETYNIDLSNFNYDMDKLCQRYNDLPIVLYTNYYDRIPYKAFSDDEYNMNCVIYCFKSLICDYLNIPYENNINQGFLTAKENWQYLNKSFKIIDLLNDEYYLFIYNHVEDLVFKFNKGGVLDDVKYIIERMSSNNILFEKLINANCLQQNMYEQLKDLLDNQVLKNDGFFYIEEVDVFRKLKANRYKLVQNISTIENNNVFGYYFLAKIIAEEYNVKTQKVFQWFIDLILNDEEDIYENLNLLASIANKDIQINQPEIYADSFIEESKLFYNLGIHFDAINRTENPYFKHLSKEKLKGVSFLTSELEIMTEDALSGTMFTFTTFQSYKYLYIKYENSNNTYYYLFEVKSDKTIHPVKIYKHKYPDYFNVQSALLNWILTIFSKNNL